MRDLALVVLLLSLSGSGCTGREGMFCQEDRDCRAGLLCARSTPEGGADMSIYGICEPARRGLGTPCLRVSECSPGLRCSNEWGHFLADGRQGTCQPAPDAAPGNAADASLPDARPADAGLPPADAGPDASLPADAG
jgi:hypothetical protein